MHKIRLGPPWDASPIPSGIRHARKFGRPRTLDPAARVWLVCEHVPGAAEVRVNGTVAGTADAAGHFAADITSLLLPRNEVVVLTASERPLGAVTLEIRG